jgi:5-methyltetrahydrofolate--homocysteine methyltransferase
MIIIGEKINATRKSIKTAILARDSEAIQKQIRGQDEAGSHYIDLNAGTGEGDEAKELKDMLWLIDLALETTEKKLSIDSPNPKILQAAISHLNGRRPFLINSIKNDEAVQKELLPIIAQQKMSFIALAMDKDGIPDSADKRVKVCMKVYEAAKKEGIADENILFDSLVMPLSSNCIHARIVLDAIQMIKNEVPEAKTSLGVSNISFGLPKRSWVNEAFLIAALSRGLDASICDPTRESIRRAITLGELMAGKDKFCRRYTRALRRGEFEKKEETKPKTA